MVKSNDKIKSHNVLKKILWDYNIDAEETLIFLAGERDTLYHFTKYMIFLRVLERLSWYEILDLHPKSTIKNMLSENTICKLRNKNKE